MAWLTVGFIAAVLAGFHENPYLTYVRQMPPPHPYPVNTVLWITVFMSAQTVIVLTIIKPRGASRSASRALLITLVSLGALVFAMGGAMHAPPAYGIYLYWLLVFLAVSILWLIWCIVSAAMKTLSGN